MNEFEIFKAGTHTSSNGTTKDYSIKDLEFIASSYNPAENEAPIVIGHPLNNSPAYGWIDLLKLSAIEFLQNLKKLSRSFLKRLKKVYIRNAVSLLIRTES